MVPPVLESQAARIPLKASYIHEVVAPGEPFADLHVHSDCSDGTERPEAVVERAASLGFSGLAIADHDTVRGIAPARSRAQALGLTLISAVELSTTAEKGDLHILGYGVDVEDAGLLDTLSGIEATRRERVSRMLRQLNDLGVKVDLETFFARYPEGSVGRLHVARFLMEAGHVTSRDEAFQRYLGMGRPAYERVNAISPDEGIRLIRKAGGVPALAHPGRTHKDHLIASLTSAGLQAVEVYHSGHPPAAARYYKELVAQKGLLPVGGSDCHGAGKDQVLMGRVKVPMEYLKALQRAGAREEPGRGGG